MTSRTFAFVEAPLLLYKVTMQGLKNKEESEEEEKQKQGFASTKFHHHLDSPPEKVLQKSIFEDGVETLMQNMNLADAGADANL